MPVYSMLVYAWDAKGTSLHTDSFECSKFEHQSVMVATSRVTKWAVLQSSYLIVSHGGLKTLRVAMGVQVTINCAIPFLHGKPPVTWEAPCDIATQVCDFHQVYMPCCVRHLQCMVIHFGSNVYRTTS